MNVLIEDLGREHHFRYPVKIVENTDIRAPVALNHLRFVQFINK